MNPITLSASGTEHAHRTAFFAWANMAAYNGFIAACDMASYEVRGYAAKRMQLEGDAPRPELRLMHAIPNGGKRDGVTAARLKAEGVKAGVLDVFLPHPEAFLYPLHNGTNVPTKEQGLYMGLYIEFKEPGRKTHKNGGLSDAQLEFMEAVREQGYCCRVAYTWQEAANLILAYYRIDMRVKT